MGQAEDNRRVRLERLRWHCRRALLELDIVFQRFWRDVGDELDEPTLDGLERLLQLEDHELWELVSGRRRSDDRQLDRLVKRINASATKEY